METSDNDSVILNGIHATLLVHPGEILREELRERGIKQKDSALIVKKNLGEKLKAVQVNAARQVF